MEMCNPTHPAAEQSCRWMGPVTPSSDYVAASYRPRPFLRAVFQSLARAIFTDAAPSEREDRSLRRTPKPRPRHLISTLCTCRELFVQQRPMGFLYRR